MKNTSFEVPVTLGDVLIPRPQQTPTERMEDYIQEIEFAVNNRPGFKFDHSASVVEADVHIKVHNVLTAARKTLNVDADKKSYERRSVEEFKRRNRENIDRIHAFATEGTCSPEMAKLADRIISDITATDALADRFFTYFKDLM
jgi:hypothetical protein